MKSELEEKKDITTEEILYLADFYDNIISITDVEDDDFYEEEEKIIYAKQ